jgi:hypothetical protein
MSMILSKFLRPAKLVRPDFKIRLLSTSVADYNEPVIEKKIKHKVPQRRLFNKKHML